MKSKVRSIKSVFVQPGQTCRQVTVILELVRKHTQQTQGLLTPFRILPALHIPYKEGLAGSLLL